MAIILGAMKLIMLQSRQEEEAARQRCSEIPHSGGTYSRKHRADLVGMRFLVD